MMQMMMVSYDGSAVASMGWYDIVLLHEAVVAVVVVVVEVVGVVVIVVVVVIV